MSEGARTKLAVVFLTALRRGVHQILRVAPVKVAVVSRDPGVRMEAARAFDAAPTSWSVTLHHDPPEWADLVVFGVDTASEDGVVFDPARPDGVIDEVQAALVSRPSAQVVVVTSPSGGTGASTLALHLAAEWAASTSTCLVDLDVASGAAWRLGIKASEARTWDDVDSSRESLLAAALPTRGRFRILLAPGPAASGDVDGVILRAAGEFERVVVDVPPGPAMQPCLARSGAGVLVIVPTLRCAQRAGEVLERFSTLRWAVVANRLGPGGEAGRAALQRALGRPLAIELPCAPSLRDREDRAELLTTGWSRWRLGVARLARALAEP